MKPSVLWFRAVLCLVLALSLLAPAPRADARTFHDEITIRELEIPVHVLRRGRSVHGLTRNDFRIFDEGEPREIVGFRAIDLRPPEGAATPSARAVVARHDGRRILLLFDLVFSRPHHLERSLLGARELIARQLHPDDRIAVAYLTGSGANLLLGFTRDAEEAATALETVEALLDLRHEDFLSGVRRLARLGGLPAGAGGDATAAGGRPAADLSERFGPATAVAMLGGGRLAADQESLAPFGSGYWDPSQSFEADHLRHDPHHGIDAGGPFADVSSPAASGLASAVHTVTVEIDRLALLLRGVPGQKHMLYLSEGLGRAALERLHTDQHALVRRSVEDLCETLRREGWTFHAMDVGGIPTSFSRSGFERHVLFNVVEETGGLLFENYNRIHQATRRLVDRTSATYLLSIRPEELSADGRLHRLEVRLAEPRSSTRVLHRSGYHGPRPSAERSFLERRLDTLDLLLGERNLEELRARALAGVLPARGSLVPVPVVLEIPAADLLRHKDAADLQLEVYALDAWGTVQDLWLRRLRLVPTAFEGRGDRGGLRLLAGLAVPPGDYRLRILVRDRATDRISLSTTRLTVASDPGELLPLDPVIVDRSGEWLELVALPAGPGGAAREALAPGAPRRPVVPPVSPELRRRSDLELLVVVAGSEPVELGGRLLDEEGRELPAPVEFVDRAPGDDGSFTRYLARVTTDDLAPGAYRLEVRASGGGRPEARRAVAFDLLE